MLLTGIETHTIIAKSQFQNKIWKGGDGRLKNSQIIYLVLYYNFES